jgi:4-hydroxybenzoyl-CoA thioesterase
MSFEHEFTIRFGDIDYARVVYYPRFFHLYHQTFEEWFSQALGAPYPELVVGENLGFPAVSIESEFYKPLGYGERISIRLDLEKIGTKSLTCYYTITRLSDGAKAASARITTVAVDNDSFESVEIPEKWRARFEKFKEQGGE